MTEIRVLLVDDDDALADLTTTYLQRVSDVLDVAVENGAEDAVQRLADEPFDCVVSDYEMPGTDGLELLEDVRELDPDLPFVLFTGKGSEEIASEAISAGVTDYIQKGGRERYEVLANRIENAVSEYRARREAEEATEQMSRTYRRITDAFYAVDDEWTTTYVNEKAADFLGHDPEELVGEDLREIFPKEMGEEFYEAYTEALETQEPVTVTMESVFQPGRWVEERIFPSEDGLSIYFRDVTERRRREQTLSALHEATPELVQAETEREIVRVVSEIADEVLAFPGTGVRRYDPEQNALVSVAVGGYDESVGTEDRPTLDVEDSPHGHAYREGETVTFEVDDDCRYDLDPFERTMYVPIGDYGVLSVGKREDEPFSESSVQFVEILSENAAAALERANHESELRERERRLERQNDRLESVARVVSRDFPGPLQEARENVARARETGREVHFDRVESAHDDFESLVKDVRELAGATCDSVEEGRTGEDCEFGETDGAPAGKPGRAFEVEP